MTSTLTPSNSPTTERLRAFKELTVMVSAGGSAVVDRSQDGVGFLDRKTLIGGETYTFGEYAVDVVLSLTCLSGSLSYSEGQDTSTLLEALQEGPSGGPVSVGSIPTTVADTVSVAEYGDSAMRRSVFTLNAMPVMLNDDAGVAQWGAVKLYDLPAGNIITLGAVIDADITLIETWWVDNTPGDVGLGTVAATDGSVQANAVQDIIKTTPVAALTAQVGPIDTQSDAVSISGTAGGTDADIVLNLLIDDNVAHCPQLVSNGTFASDTVWTKGVGWTIGAGVATSDASQTDVSDLSQTVANLTPGVTYATSFVVTRTAGSVQLVVGGTAGTARSTSNTFTEDLVAGADGTVVIRASADFAGTVDTVTVTPKAGTATVTGTVTVIWAQLGDIG